MTTSPEGGLSLQDSVIDEYVSNADTGGKRGQFRFGCSRKKVISAAHQTATFGAMQQ
jgi:hypothetical protein